MKVKGIFCGIMAAVCYGTNPLGALPLYQEGVNTASVLSYRFSVAVILLGITLLIERKPFAVTRHELKVLFTLGTLFAFSSITYYQSFHFMDAGIASTILFVYPIMVAAIMAVFFHIPITPATVISIVMSTAGIVLLYHDDLGAPLNIMGFVLVMLSALSYALYIVVVNRTRVQLAPIKLTFYVMLFCLMVLVAYSLSSPMLNLQLPPSPRACIYGLWLGVVPTVASLVLMTIAVRTIGATPTAVMGALEPMTAVAIGIMVFRESLTLNLALGIIVILIAVLIVVVGNKLHLPRRPHWIHVRKKLV